MTNPLTHGAPTAYKWIATREPNIGDYRQFEVWAPNIDAARLRASAMVPSLDGFTFEIASMEGRI